MNDTIEKILEEKYPEYKLLPIVNDINADENPREDFWNNLSTIETYDINAQYLKVIGNAKYDYLMCWEPGRLDDENESIFDYPSLYEFDYKWWEFQKEAEYKNLEDLKDWMEKGSEYWTPERVAESINRVEERYADGYSIYCSGDWFRMIENDTFLYSQIISAKWFIYYELEQYIDNLQEKLLPYSLNEDDYDFETLLNEDDPTKRYKANGRELELESLKKLIGKYLNTSLLPLIEKFMKTKNFNGFGFRFDRGYDRSDPKNFDPFTDFIFWDEDSLKSVRLTNFLEDFSKIRQDDALLLEFIESIKKQVKKDFMDIYNDNASRFL